MNRRRFFAAPLCLLVPTITIGGAPAGMVSVAAVRELAMAQSRAVREALIGFVDRYPCLSRDLSEVLEEEVIAISLRMGGDPC